MNDEIWEQLPKPFQSYEISSVGRCRNFKYKNILSLKKLHSEGYISYSLFIDGKNRKCYAHRLVMMAFNPMFKKELCVNHKNGKRDDNRIVNLECVTYKENALHRSNRNRDIGVDFRYSQLNKAVVQYSLKGNFIKKYVSVREAARKTGVNSGSITNSCKGKAQTGGGFVWGYIKNKYFDGELWKEFTINKNIIKASNFGRFILRNNVITIGSRRVGGYRTIAIGNKTYFAHRIIAEAFCVKPNILEELIVDHMNGIRSDNHVENLRWITKSQNAQFCSDKKMRPVRAIHLETNRVIDFLSIKKAAEELFINRSHISNILAGRAKTAKGYYFEYK